MPPTLEVPSQVRHLAQVLRWAALALLLCLISNLLSQVLPPMLTSSAWQMQLSESLIAQAPLVILAVCCLQLASWLHGSTPAGQRSAELCRRLALPLGVAYLSVIPLQGVAAWSAWRADTQAAEQRVQSLQQNLSQLRAEANRASAPSELDKVLRQLPRGGPALSSLGSDLPSQRRQLVIGLNQASGQLTAAAKQRRVQGLQVGLRRFTRVLVSAMGLAGLLMVVAQWRPRRSARLSRLFRRRSRRRLSSGAYLRQLSREQSSP